ncbi:MAG: helix-turn-helix domain-containing protein [Bacteroidales bacterium]|jgi:HTH-type transcriptional regulator/antitoxin HigA|nr:helix-turn-helix domain-containing protein [Bacteroidales bacterium]
MSKIKNEKQYKALLSRIDEIFFATDENTPADDPRLLELDLLSALVEEYEKEHFPIETPSLPAVMNERLTENEWSQKEMAVILGITAPRLSAILSGKVHPTYEQARVISSRLNIDPAIVLAV